jgi:4'-phosphopantetheinyl transferase
VEKIRPQSADDELVGHYLAPGELNRLRALPVSERVNAFFECWTRKEAFLKARGDGLMGRLDTFEVSFGRNARPAILRLDETERTRDWTVVPLPVGASYAGALVVEGECGELCSFQWTPSRYLSRAMVGLT